MWLGFCVQIISGYIAQDQKEKRKKNFALMWIKIKQRKTYHPMLQWQCGRRAVTGLGFPGFQFERVGFGVGISYMGNFGTLKRPMLGSKFQIEKLSLSLFFSFKNSPKQTISTNAGLYEPQRCSQILFWYVHNH